MKMAAAVWNVREARIDDIRVMTSLLKELHASVGARGFDERRQRAGLRRLIGRNDAAVLVVEWDGLVVGMCAVQIIVSMTEGALVGLLQDLIVHAKFRRRGIGQALLHAAGKWAFDRKLSSLELLADPVDDDALAFFRSQGWQVTRPARVRTAVGHHGAG